MDTKIVGEITKYRARIEELETLLVDPSVLADNARISTYSKELSEIKKKVIIYDKHLSSVEELPELELMLEAERDNDLRSEISKEIDSCRSTIKKTEEQLKELMIERDPSDEKSVFVEIRAAAGGDESAIFAGDLFRMYSRYADAREWSIEVVSQSAGAHGGYKEIIFNILGYEVYKILKFESGAHRVQRVPETEAQGRVHTSTCTIAVMPYDDSENVAIDIKKEDLKIDTFRASGAGGQHVNKTDSAIRITHIPTGVIVECQEERSQHKNRSKALSLLAAKLKQAEEEKKQKEFSSKRRLLVGTGDRSERIRTYNFPQGRLTDHRIGLTLYSLDRIVEGELQELFDHLYSFYISEETG